MRSLLDPLFNRKIFTAVCLALSVSITMYLVFRTLGLPPDLAPESVDVVRGAGSFVQLETPYEHGFRRGYNAFLAQTGKYIPQPSVSASRVASYSSDDENVLKGYVDGYHKATEIECCPRSYYE